MVNLLGLTEEQMHASHEHYHRENPEALRSRCHQCKLDRQHENHRAVRFVCEVIKEDSSLTVQELASAVSRRPAWIRRTLGQHGLTAPEAVKPVLLPRSKRPCMHCGHLRCHHCRGTSPRVHVNPGLGGHYICPRVPHCKGLVEQSNGQFTNCSCGHFTTSTEKKSKKLGSFTAAEAIPRGLVLRGGGIL